MSQSQKSKRFADLHVKGEPLVLYNAWDAGSAKTIVEAGAKAVATSSWAVAGAHGYGDGEAIPKDLVETIARRVVQTVSVPVSIDFEGGYSEDDGELGENVRRLMETGIVGINFEDREVRGSGLHPIERQARRIKAIRTAAAQKGVDLFINARTDLFLGRDGHERSVAEAIARGKAYADAGASGLFVPGLVDETLIERVVASVALPVNVMVMRGVPSNARLAGLGVARISYGAIPYADAMTFIGGEARKILS